ncbi:MAG: DegV family protein [Lachnospiraceae bacterium]|nr:DegV family protein [Lachnospiraceae bacterium]
MQTIGIITDSHSGITQKQAEQMGIYVLPMPFYIEDECFYEGRDLTYEQFMERLKRMDKVSTSQPSPIEVTEIWDRVLETYDEIVYIPISSGLSGSCATAKMLAEEDPYKGKVFVVDNGTVSALTHQSVLDAQELSEQGLSAEQIMNRLEASKKRKGIYVTVENLQYLKNGGRVSASTAIVGDLLRVKPVLYFDTGTLDVVAKCRGKKKAKAEMITQVKHLFETEYKKECEEGNMHLLAASSADAEETAQWVAEIQEAFPGMEVLSDPLACSISCHIGPGGLGIGFSCRP